MTVTASHHTYGVIGDSSTQASNNPKAFSGEYATFDDEEDDGGEEMVARTPLPPPPPPGETVVVNGPYRV